MNLLFQRTGSLNERDSSYHPQGEWALWYNRGELSPEGTKKMMTRPTHRAFFVCRARPG